MISISAKATKWGIFDDVYCSKNETIQFIENILDEVITLFPSTYIHIGFFFYYI
jgi:hexosaminidase